MKKEDQVNAANGNVNGIDDDKGFKWVFALLDPENSNSNVGFLSNILVALQAPDNHLQLKNICPDNQIC